MLYHCSHNIDTKILLENIVGCEELSQERTYYADGCIEVDELPNKPGRWKMGDWYYEYNDKGNWMRWKKDGELIKYTWYNKQKVKGSYFNANEQLIENEVKKYMELIGVRAWAWRFLKLMPDDKMIWHIDNPVHAPRSINIALKDSAPIVFDDGEFEYKCALINVSDKWHTVKTGKTERLTFKIVPKEPFEVVKEKLSLAGFLL